MKKQFILSSLLFVTLLCFSTQAKAETNVSDESLYSSLKGKIILRVELNGEAYYVHPNNNKMYYLGRPADAFQVMREQGVGITNNDLNRIRLADDCPYYSPNCMDESSEDKSFANNQKGKIFLQVENNGEAWYVDPSNSRRYFLGRPIDAFNIMRERGLGINENDFNNLKDNNTSVSIKNGSVYLNIDGEEKVVANKNEDESQEKYRDYQNAKLSPNNKFIAMKSTGWIAPGALEIYSIEKNEKYYANARDDLFYWTDDNLLVVEGSCGSGISCGVFKSTNVEEPWKMRSVSLEEDFNIKILEEITFNEKTYRAYKNRITVAVNNVENVIYELDQQINIDAGEVIYFISDTPNLKLSPSGYILFFDYFRGLSTCRMNGLQLDSNTLLWDSTIGCGATTYWSPDRKQVALAWNHYDDLNLYISNYGDVKTLSKKFEVLYPDNPSEHEMYWRTNDVFIFKPKKEYVILNDVKDSFEENNVKVDINEFITR